MTGRWTDDRMDDLKGQVDELGRRMERGFADQRQELNMRFDRFEASLDARFERIDERFERIDERFDKIDERFERIDERFERIYEHFEKVDARFEKVDERFHAVLEAIDGKSFEISRENARTQAMVISLHATLTRFSLGLAGAVVVAVIAALLAS